MNRGNHSLAVVLVFILTACSIAQDKRAVLTNEQVVTAAVRETALKSDLFDDISDIHLVPTLHGIERPVYSGLVEAMSSKGISVLSETGGSSTVLGFVILGLEFAYEKGESRGFLRKPMIKRVLDARVKITILKADDGEILKTEDISFDYSDEIDPESGKLVKSPDISELSPRAPGSYWSKIVEPVVVTTAVGGLVYLFFANR